MNYVVPRLFPVTKSINVGQAANVAASVTIPAPGVARRTIIDCYRWSYSGGTPVGKITITENGVTVLEFDITVAGPGADGIPIVFGVNTEIVVTLAAGGAGVTGKLNVFHYSEPESPNKLR